MAKKDLIEAISPNSLEALVKYNEALAVTLKTFKEAAELANNKNPFGDPKKASKLSTELNNLKIAEEQLRKEQALRVIAEKELAVLQDKQAAKKQALIKKTEDEKAASRELNREKKLEAQLARSLTGSYNALSAQYELNRIKINKLSTDTDKLTQEEKDLIKETANLRIEMKKSQEDTGNHTLNVGNYAAAWGSATGVMGKLSAVSGVAGSSLLLLSKKFLPFAAGAGVVYGLVSAFRNAYTAVKEFDAAMANVNAITGASKGELNQLKELAVNLGSSTKFSATEIAGLETELAKLGYTTSQVIASTEAVTLAAAATGEGLLRTAEIVGSTTMAFGLTASETQRTADVMAESFNRTALSLEDYAESIKYVAPVAKQAGISIEETSALLGVLANSGIKGSMAGTSLRNIFTELIGTGGNLQEKIKELAKNGLNLASAEDEVGKRAQTSLLILKDAIDTIPDLTKGLENAGGAAQEMADKQLDSLKGKTELMTKAWNAFILSVDNGTGKFSTSIKTMIIDATSAINGFRMFLQSGEERALGSSNRIAKERIKGLKVRLISQKDQAKYMSDEIIAERNVYKAKQARIDQIKQTIRENNNAGGSWIKNNKALQEEANGLQKSVNMSVAYVNAVAGLRESRRQELIQAKVVSDIVKDNQETQDDATDSTVKLAKAYNKLALEMQPAIEAAQEMASSDLMNYEEREQAAMSWFILKTNAEDEALRVSLKNLKDEYDSNVKSTKQKITDGKALSSDLITIDKNYASEKERILLESRNAQIAITKESDSLIFAITEDMAKNELKAEEEKLKEIQKLNDKAIKDREDAERESEQRKQQLIAATLQTLGALYNDYYNTQIDKINTEQDSKLNALDRQKEAELNNANLTAEQKEGIETQYQIDQYQIKFNAFEREKELKKQAVYMDAAMGAVRIIAENAGDWIAIGVLGALLGATTLSSIAAIDATQYPAFEHGGTMEKAGLALVSERHQEYGMTSDGMVFQTPKDPSLIHLDKGTQIFPEASQLINAMIMRTSADAAVFNFSTKDLERTFSREIGSLRKEIGNLRQEKEPENLMGKIKAARALKLN